MYNGGSDYSLALFDSFYINEQVYAISTDRNLRFQQVMQQNGECVVRRHFVGLKLKAKEYVSITYSGELYNIKYTVNIVTGKVKQHTRERERAKKNVVCCY